MAKLIFWNASWPHLANRMNPVVDAPLRIDGSEYKMPVGAVIAAIGQKPAIRRYPGFGSLDLTRRETIRVRSHNQQTNIPDVFAGGDAVTGPATVVEAIGGGKTSGFCYARISQRPKDAGEGFPSTKGHDCAYCSLITTKNRLFKDRKFRLLILTDACILLIALNWGWMK